MQDLHLSNLRYIKKEIHKLMHGKNNYNKIEEIVTSFVVVDSLFITYLERNSY